MRLVTHKPQIAGLAEIRRSWSITDVLDYNDYLDVEEEQQLRGAEAAFEQRKMYEAMRRK